MRFIIFSAVLSVVSATVPANTEVVHIPRDGDRLHPGMAGARSLMLSVTDSTRTVLLNPEMVVFDSDRDTSVYVDGDTISYVQFATKHRLLLRYDTLSYIGYENHASGARPDEVPTGLGWTLNAGGAVTRTILGGPDMEIAGAYTSDRSYYRKTKVDSLVNEIKNGRGNGHLRELTDPQHYRDSESDRYCFNAGGHTGVFRYSYKDGRYITLDCSPCVFDSYYSGDSSYFLMYAPDNCISKAYQYSPTTAAYTWYEFDIRKHEQEGVDMYFGQKLLSSIEWNGNTVSFDQVRHLKRKTI